MKVRAIAAFFLACLAPSAPAHAQVLIFRGSVNAKDCYFAAKTGVDAATGVAACNRALAETALTGHDRAGTYVNRGVLEVALKENDQAIADYAAAIAVDPSMGDAYVNAGSALIRLQRYPEALDQINKGLELGMSSPAIGYYDRAVAEERMGQYKDAYHDYQKVLEIDPDFTQASEALKYFTVIRRPAAEAKPS